MAKYVQGRDGKFAGSIGDGKARVPSVMPAGSPSPTQDADLAAGVQLVVDTACRRLSSQVRSPDQRRGHEMMSAVKLANLPSTDSVHAAFLRASVRRLETAASSLEWAEAQKDLTAGVAGVLFPGAASIRFVPCEPGIVRDPHVLDVRDRDGRTLFINGSRDEGDQAENRRAVLLESMLGGFARESLADYFPTTEVLGGRAYLLAV